ncbi:IS5 family transposase [Cellulosimicrobium cellulans]|uniref:IS5 family transposase n=1 Tax=Cellulosimicrobium cellulans TaxID=1710 RepID=UPI002404E683|nr:IS5 family transposase [Cellulosimicrobium cellulans]
MPTCTIPCDCPGPRRRYPSDLTDAAWAPIAALVAPTHTRGVRPCCEHRWREYVNALLIVVTTGIPWRALPHDFPVSWSATHKHFTKWTRRGLWQRVLTMLRRQDRIAQGRHEHPTAAVVDSSSVQSTPVPGPRGFDGAKKVDGINRHILVDTAGRFLAAHVTAANVQDRAAFTDLLTKNPCPSVAHVWADKGCYTGTAPAQAATKAGIELQIVSGPKPVGAFIVQPRRWVVERTNGWINRHRRLARQHESTLTAHRTFIILSQIRLLLRRLDRRGQLFDRLEQLSA